MIKYYNIDLDGIDGYDHWEDYTVNTDDIFTDEVAMCADVRAGLRELGGGHADIWDADTDKLYAEIEV